MDLNCSPALSRILTAQLQRQRVHPHPNLLCVPSEDDIRIWYFMIVGLDAPFKYGEYIFKLTAPDEFPSQPPRFEFCTINGVFELGGPICISIGEFHPDDKAGIHGAYGWRGSLGMPGFAREVVNGLINFKDLEGIRIRIEPDFQKTVYATKSRHRNEKNMSRIYSLFETVIQDFPDIEPVRNAINARDQIRGGTLTPPRVHLAKCSPAPAPPGAEYIKYHIRADNLAVTDTIDWKVEAGLVVLPAAPDVVLPAEPDVVLPAAPDVVLPAETEVDSFNDFLEDLFRDD